MKLNAVFIHLLLLLLFLLGCESKNPKESDKRQESVTLSTPTDTLVRETEYIIEPTDTITSDGITIIFQPCPDSLEFVNDHDDDHINLADSLKKIHSNYRELCLKIESLKQRSFPHYFTRKDSVLGLKLNNGHTLALKDHLSIEDEANEHYTFYEYINFPEIYLISAQYYEGSGFVMVNKENGEKVYTIGPPVFINEDFICYNSDLGAGYDTNGLEYGTIEKGRFKKLTKINIANWEPTQVRWINEKQFVVMKTEYPDGISEPGEISYTFATIVR